MPNWAKDEDKWKKAKEVAREQYPDAEGDDFWKLVTGIYKKMGGEIQKSLTPDFGGRPVLAVFTKSHPITQAAARGTPAPDLNDGDVRRNPGEPSPEQAQADRYKKPVLKWNGLTIRVENPAGSVRRGRSRTGVTWETRMVYDYGYVSGSEGVDGDEVDVYVGPNPDAPMVYVVHQRKAGDWKAYDEDKVMLGFDDQASAEAAYLKHYDDPRFLGPVTAMTVEEFKAQVRATKEAPKMIKGMVVFVKAQPTPAAGDRIEFLSDRHTDKGPSAGEITDTKVTADGLYVKIRHSDEERLFSWEDLRGSATKKGNRWLIKAHVRAHTRRTSSGKVVSVGPYSTKVQKRGEAAGQMDMFAGGEKKAPDAGKRKKFYVTMIRDGKKKPAFLAGPFDTHDEALAQVDAARKKAHEVDPWSEFDAFGTTGMTANRHPPGVLNEHLGIGAKDKAEPKAEPKVILPKKSGSEVEDYSKMSNNSGESDKTGGAMDNKFDTLDLQDPKTYEQNPELATLARHAADKNFKPGSISRGDFKRQVLAGKHPEIVREMLKEREAKERAEADSKKKSKKAATSILDMDLPSGYAVTKEGDNLIVFGHFDDDLHTRIKRVGGQWDGRYGTNRRVWIVPAEKSASLKRVLQNWTKANRDRVEAEAEKRKAAAEKQAEARKEAPTVQPGTYGPFTVTESARDPNKYVVSFKYDPELVSTVKTAKSARFNRDTKNWLIDKADGAKLQDILDQGKSIAEQKAAEAEEAKRKEAAERKAAKEAEAEDRKRRGISDAYMWADRYGNLAYGGALPSVGQTIKRGDEYHVVTAVSRGRYEEDASSFGGTDDAAYQHKVTLRRATDEEVAAEKEREAAAQRKVQAQKDLDSATREIQQAGTRPEAADPQGDVVLDTFNIYGGGERIVIGDDKIWYVRNNGMDGDNWAVNNVRTGGAGAIGWHVPKTPELEERIRQAAQYAH